MTKWLQWSCIHIGILVRFMWFHPKTIWLPIVKTKSFARTNWEYESRVPNGVAFPVQQMKIRIHIFFVLLATMPYVWPNAQHHDKVRDEEEKWDTNYSFVACDYESGHFPDKCDEHIWVRTIRQAQGFSAILRTTRRRKNTQIVHDLVTKMLLNHDMPNSQRMQ